MQKQKTGIITYSAFFVTLVIVGINLVTLFFPALIVTSISDAKSTIDPFEVGTWTIPFLTANLIILIFGILYYTKKLPNKIKNGFTFILNFEISRNAAAIVITIILGIYVGNAMPELNAYEGDTWGDFERIEDVLKDYPYGNEGLSYLKILHVQNFLLYSSEVVFQNIKVVPFLASITLLLMTYFFTVQIAKKRFAGIVSMVVVLQSHTFQQYDTLATYTNFWTLLYLFSLYVIYKKWYLSPVAYLASIFTKPFIAAFFPMTLFFTYRAEIPRRKKFFILATYVGIVVAFLGAISLSNSFSIKILAWDSVDFWSGFTAWAFQLRFDGFVLMFLLPVTVGLFIVSQRGNIEADSVLILIMGTLLLMPLLAALTWFNLHPYRYVPFIVFFAVGIGTLLSNKIIKEA